MFTTSGHHFVRNGTPHLVVSGAIHYPRVHPDQWADRLRRLRAMGANTVETYVPWNFHSPAQDVIDFTGWRDLGRFLDLAAEADLDAIVRPGPYVCAEWDAGGIPAWVSGQELRLRCSDPPFLAHVDAWFDQVVPLIAARQYPAGGRVVLVQVENEYGSYGDDIEYMKHLRDGLIARGITVPLVTSDGPSPAHLNAGTVDGVLPTLNFGSRTHEALQLFRDRYGDRPAMCMEFWNGWFDHWGERHHTRSADDAAAELGAMLSAGMSCNIYLAHGGTNFGLWNGANHHEALQPTVTSYDYDSPIAEHGALTDKFHAYREVIARHVTVPEMPADLLAGPSVMPARTLDELTSGTLTPDGLAALAHLSVERLPGLRTLATPFPPTFDDLGLDRGLLLLRADVQHEGGAGTLRLHGLADRAHVFIDGVLVGVRSRDVDAQTPLEFTAEEGTLHIDIVVESLGRINFGPLLGERKGILSGVWFATHFITGWQGLPIALDHLGGELAAHTADGDGFPVRQFRLHASGGADAFLDVADQTRGYAFVDELMLGRYHRIGPQQTLYVPAPLLEDGDHVVTLIDTDGEGGMLRISEAPVLDVVNDPARTGQ